MSNVSSTMGSTLGKIAKVSSKIGKLGSFGTVGKFGRKPVPDLSRKKVLSSVGINLTEFGEKVVSNLTEFETFMQSKNVSEKVSAKLDEMGFKNFGNRMRKMGHTVRKFKFGKNGKRVLLGSDGQPKPTGHEYDDIVSSSGTIIRMFENGARQIIGKNGDIIGTLPVSYTHLTLPTKA